MNKIFINKSSGYYFIPTSTQNHCNCHHADLADFATNADHAALADFATNATHADSATNADHATDANTLDNLDSSQFLRSDTSGSLHGNLVVNGNLSAPIFYDIDNTSYYLDPNGTSKLYNINTNDITTTTISANLIHATGNRAQLTFSPPGSTFTIMHNFGTVDYAVTLGTDNLNALVAWQNKTTTTVNIICDLSFAPVLTHVDVILLP